MSLNVHHRRVVKILAATALADIILGILMGMTEHCSPWHGMYCTTGLTTTDGCDLAFHGWQAYILATIAMILMVPLWSAAFSFFTTGLTADHIDRKHDEMTTTVRGSQ